MGGSMSMSLSPRTSEVGLHQRSGAWRIMLQVLYQLWIMETAVLIAVLESGVKHCCESTLLASIQL